MRVLAPTRLRASGEDSKTTWTGAAAVWNAASWNDAYSYCGYPAEPVYYDYGSNVVYEGETVYVDGNSVGTQEQYAQQAIVVADTGRQAPASKEEEWLSLGVFAMIQGERTDSNDLFQLAVNKAGTIRGNYYNALTDTTLPVYGAVDKATQRAAWTVGDKKEIDKAQWRRPRGLRLTATAQLVCDLVLGSSKKLAPAASGKSGS